MSTPENLQLTVQESSALAQSPVEQILRAAVANGVTTENVAVIERLTDLYERLQAKDAEKRFAAAFVALQADIPVIVASTLIPNRGKYERFEDVMRVVGPLLSKHGFTVSFSMDYKDNRILETCQLRHIDGHSQSNSFAVRPGKADTDTQADCKAATTAKRNALLNCLNIVIRQDVLSDEQDAAQDGSPISWDQAEYLRQQVRETNSDEPAFLRFAGVEKYEDIGAARYDLLIAALAKKAKK